jgi:hypothetical protein
VETALDGKGKKLGDPFDGDDPDVRPAPLVRMGTVELSAGSHVLRFTAVGKNPASGGYRVGIDYLCFKHVK